MASYPVISFRQHNVVLLAGTDVHADAWSLPIDGHRSTGMQCSVLKLALASGYLLIPLSASPSFLRSGTWLSETHQTQN
jgi:hypothetical protein